LRATTNLAKSGDRPLAAARTASRQAAAEHPALALTALLGAVLLGNVDLAIANIAGGTAYVALGTGPGQGVHGFATINLALAVTALCAAALAALSVRHRETTSRRD
jgi:hypothetical protein